MNEFLDAWQQVPPSWQTGIIVAAIVLLVFATGAAVKHALTFRLLNRLSGAFADKFTPQDVVERDSSGRERRRRPTPAEAKRQRKRCFHVWRVCGGYVTFISSRCSDELNAEEVKARAKKADASMTHEAREFMGGYLLRSWRNDV